MIAGTSLSKCFALIDSSYNHFSSLIYNLEMVIDVSCLRNIIMSLLQSLLKLDDDEFEKLQTSNEFEAVESHLNFTIACLTSLNSAIPTIKPKKKKKKKRLIL